MSLASKHDVDAGIPNPRKRAKKDGENEQNHVSSMPPSCPLEQWFQRLEWIYGRHSSLVADIKSVVGNNEVDHNCNNDLHLACQYQAPLDAISLLVKRNPSHLIEENYGGELPLHLACMYYAPPEVISLLARKGGIPTITKTCPPFGETPIHLACWKRAPVEVISALLEEYPASIYLEDSDGMTPLHKACCHYDTSDVSLEVVSLLLEKWPECVEKSTKAPTNHTPFSYLCQSARAPLNVISMVLEKFPNIIKHKTCPRSPNALQIACKARAPTEVISLLLNKWPAAAREVTAYSGQIALQLACESKADNNILKLLLKENPFALIWRDMSGRTLSDYDTDNLSFEINEIMECITLLLYNQDDNTMAANIVWYFTQNKWWEGVAAALQICPAAVNCMSMKNEVVPSLLSFVGRQCNLLTVWGIIKNSQELFLNI